jgi:hypothetical protein
MTKLTEAHIPQGKMHVLSFRLTLGKLILDQGPRKRDWTADECAEAFKHWRRAHESEVNRLKNAARRAAQTYERAGQYDQSRQMMIDVLDDLAGENTFKFDDLLKHPDMKYPIGLLAFACKCDEEVLHRYLRFIVDYL